METEKRPRRSPMRLFAPLAIVIAAVALVMVISSAKDSGGNSSGSAGATEKAQDLGSSPSSKKKKHSSSKKDKLPQDVYIVKQGDTLGDIADKTGVPVARLQELNPGLDQFSLVAGQRIKLR